MPAPSVGAYAVDIPPGTDRYLLSGATVPVCSLELAERALLTEDIDGLARIDIQVDGGRIERITPASAQDPTAAAVKSAGRILGAAAALGATQDTLTGLAHVNGHDGGAALDVSATLAGAALPGQDALAPNGAVAEPHPSISPSPGLVIDLHGKMIFPTFVDMHTHIDKSHTGDRSRNPFGSLAGADASTAADGLSWTAEELDRRIDFSLACAHAHGTSALRTHLINMTPRQVAMTWPAFSSARARWRGRVELQGVSLVTLAFYRDAAAAEALADLVASHGGILGAAVCSTDAGGTAEDDWTTCGADRPALLDRIFSLAHDRDLDVDFHVDENGNPESKGALDVAEAVVRARATLGFRGAVVAGHCCSLATRSDAEADADAAALARAGVHVVSLPLVNEWTQDRRNAGRTARESARDATRVPGTPRRRGLTALHELARRGVRVALASDNTRDQFYAYGDLDMLQVFTRGTTAGHLDRPHGSWPDAVTRTPADIMFRGGGGGDGWEGTVAPRGDGGEEGGERVRGEGTGGATAAGRHAEGGRVGAKKGEGSAERQDAGGFTEENAGGSTREDAGGSAEERAGGSARGVLERGGDERGGARGAGAASRGGGARPAAPPVVAHGRLSPGRSADFVLFRARRFSELLSRPQGDRVVVRGGKPLYIQPPAFEVLDALGPGFAPADA